MLQDLPHLKQSRDDYVLKEKIKKINETHLLTLNIPQCDKKNILQNFDFTNKRTNTLGQHLQNMLIINNNELKNKYFRISIIISYILGTHSMCSIHICTLHKLLHFPKQTKKSKGEKRNPDYFHL